MLFGKEVADARLPAEQDVVILMGDDRSRPPSHRAGLARLQTVLPQLHTVAAAVTAGWQNTPGSIGNIEAVMLFSPRVWSN